MHALCICKIHELQIGIFLIKDTCNCVLHDVAVIVNSKTSCVSISGDFSSLASNFVIAGVVKA